MYTSYLEFRCNKYLLVYNMIIICFIIAALNICGNKMIEIIFTSRVYSLYCTLFIFTLLNVLFNEENDK